MQPLFTIIIPVFERPREIQRAMQSCLSQCYTDFELIVVDDASTDGTASAIRSFEDNRVRLVQHSVNQGQGPARNSGVDAAGGKWLVFMDSDHALQPGAIRRIAFHIENESQGADRFGFRQQWDTGIITPDPAPSGGILDYHAWIRFAESTLLADFLLCTKKLTFQTVRWPTVHTADMEYHLSFAKVFTTRLVNEILAIQYTDSVNRITASKKMASRELYTRRAQFDIESRSRIIESHGEQLRRHAPRLFELICRVQILSYFICGQKSRGFELLAPYLAQCSFRFIGLLSILCAGLSPWTFLSLQHQKMSRLQ